MCDLGQAVNEKSYLITKIFSDGIEVDKCVLDHVVKQPGSDRDIVKPHIGKNVGNLEWMDEIGLARGPLLAAMVKRREEIRPPDEVNIRSRTVPFYFLNDIFYPDH
jgi:hypothetical protein